MSFELPPTFVQGFHDEALVRRMEYLDFGKTALKVSKVSLGGGTFSKFYGPADENISVRTIQMAVKTGINYFDTAPWYGQGRSETLYGKAFKDIPRQAFYIATKVGRYELDFQHMFDFSAKKTEESVNKSLQLLGLDYIDIIQIHDIEFAPILDIVINETLPTLEKLRNEGKVRFIGVTGYPLHVLKEAITRAKGRFDMTLSYARYTLIDSTFLGFYEFCKEQNLGVVCASGHAMGLLTNKGPQPWHPAGESIKKRCNGARLLCESEGVEMGRLAMYHFLQLKGPTLLVGMESPELLTMNLDVYYNGLIQSEKELLDVLLIKIFFQVKDQNWEGVELERYWNQMNKIAGVNEEEETKEDAAKLDEFDKFTVNFVNDNQDNHEDNNADVQE